jgi:hypothetical protein
LVRVGCPGGRAARLARFVLSTSPLNTLVHRDAVQILRTTVRFLTFKSNDVGETVAETSLACQDRASISQFLTEKLGETRERDSASARKSKELVVEWEQPHLQLETRSLVVLNRM